MNRVCARASRIELGVAHPQPALRCWTVLVQRVKDKRHELPFGIELVDRDEQARGSRSSRTFDKFQAENSQALEVTQKATRRNPSCEGFAHESCRYDHPIR